MARILRLVQTATIDFCSVVRFFDEVFKVLLREASEEAAIQGVAAMQRGRIIDLTVQRLATFRGYAAGRPVGQNAP